MESGTPFIPPSLLPKERGILFRDRLVRAILEGRKTQTRRGMGKVPIDGRAPVQVGGAQDPGLWGYAKPDGNMDRKAGTFRCPYGEPGDRLWVREAWAPCLEKPGGIHFRAGGTDTTAHTPFCDSKWKPGIHLHRRNARILLEVIEVRVQRLQDITPADAIAEGLERRPLPLEDAGWLDAAGHGRPAVEAFASLWDSIHGDDPYACWGANPFAWAITFRRLQP